MAKLAQVKEPCPWQPTALVQLYSAGLRDPAEAASSHTECFKQNASDLMADVTSCHGQS